MGGRTGGEVSGKRPFKAWVLGTVILGSRSTGGENYHSAVNGVQMQAGTVINPTLQVGTYWYEIRSQRNLVPASKNLLFTGGSVVKNLPASVGDLGSIPGSRRSPWRRKWQPTPIFLPGKSHGQRNLEGCSPWDRKRVRHDSVTQQNILEFNLLT